MLPQRPLKTLASQQGISSSITRFHTVRDMDILPNFQIPCPFLKTMFFSRGGICIPSEAYDDGPEPSAPCTHADPRRAHDDNEWGILRPPADDPGWRVRVEEQNVNGISSWRFESERCEIWVHPSSLFRKMDAPIVSLTSRSRQGFDGKFDGISFRWGHLCLRLWCISLPRRRCGLEYAVVWGLGILDALRFCLGSVMFFY